MFIDNSLLWDAEIDYGINAGNADSSTFDTGAAGAYAGMEVLIRTTEAATASGEDAPTFTFHLYHGAATGPVSGGEILYSSKAFAKAGLPINTTVWKVVLPSDHLRYLQIRVTVGAANATAGMCEVYLLLDRQTVE